MKVLIFHFRYFVSGGPERYMFNLMEELRNRGHETIPFSIKYTRNNPSEYDSYFVDPLGSKDELLFRDQKLSLQSIYRTTMRLFYDPKVAQAVIHLINDTKPQIAYGLDFLKKLSPAVLVGMKKKGLPVVVRLTDYFFVCPGVHCNREDKPCDLCVSGNIFPSIRYRCVQNSLVASSLNALAVQYHRSRKFFDLIDMFVVTNYFMYKMMLRAGYPENRLRLIPTFVKTQNNQEPKSINSTPIIVFVGRIERIKGVHVLLEAINLLRKNNPNLEFIVKIVGAGDIKYIDELEALIMSNNLENQVSLTGELSYPELSSLLKSAFISIIPSIIYENLPNALLESFTFGTPVIGSNLGSLSYVINDKHNGLLFWPGDANDLAQKIKYCLKNPAVVLKMGVNAEETARKEYSPEKHVTKLLSLFNELVG